ncbi:MAG TPA: VWA domain-containing protein [Planctomycetota bacterium]|nr:VWA domain-containing protein [Planctomycetota bacterium]
MNARMGWIATAVMLAVTAGLSFAQTAEAPKPLIQIAILLDNSGSMSGLIEQAKTQLWRMVNEFITMKRNGQRPEIQVALYTYGNPPPRRLLTLTNDLDKVSEQLFAVRISGGSEYCGQVIKTAVDELEWSTSGADLKVIIIAGNEPFTQGQVDYRDACKAAIARGIIVNTIHCGSVGDGVSGMWKDGADLADGQFLCINQNRQVVHITAPQDAELAKLSVELNRTYVAYGARGEAGRANQSAQDANAATVAPSVAAERAKTKASENYANAAWDLIDAVKEGKVKLDDVKVEDLPKEMQEMDPAARKAYVETQQKKRAEVQGQIRELSKARDVHIAEERKKLSEKGEDTLDAAVIKAVREQAQEKNFKTE